MKAPDKQNPKAKKGTNTYAGHSVRLDFWTNVKQNEKMI